MKHFDKIFILTIMSFLPSVVSAQPDVKTFEGKGVEYIISKLGNPESIERGEEDESFVEMSYPSCFICVWEEDNSLDRVIVEDQSLKFLSDYISGGVKVGDNANALMRYDFSKTKYGRGKKENNLKLMRDPIKFYGSTIVYNYVLFESELNSMCFAIHNKEIVAIMYRTFPDYPYEGYDPSNKIW